MIRSTRGVVDLRAAAENPPPKIDLVIPGLKSGSVAALVAAGGAGKTMLALQLLMAVAAGIRADIAGCFIPTKDWPTGRVLAALAEDAVDILQRRLHFMFQKIPPDVREIIYERVTVQSLYEELTYLVQRGPTGAPEVNQPLYDALKAACTDMRLLILDPLRQWHMVSENSTEEMTYVIQIFKKLAAETGCAILFLHHVNKMSITSGSGDDQAASRGSTAITDNIRFQMNLVVMRQDEAEGYGVKREDCKQYLRLVSAKANYCDSAEHWLQRVRDLEGVLVPANMTNRGSRFYVAGRSEGDRHHAAAY